MIRALVTLVLILAVASCGSTAADERETRDGVPATLRVGLIPNIAPEEQEAKYQPFADYLADELGVEVELFVASDYAGVVAALVGGRIDVAYLGGLTYVQAEQQVELTPLVTEIDHETGTTKYLSAIVARADSDIDDIDDVVAEGRTFAFGDVSSTSGSLYPRIMLTDAGARCDARRVEQCPPLERVDFTGGHDATALAVLGGKVDAGGVELRILHRLENEGTVTKGALRVVEEREVPGYPWVMRTELGDRAAQRISEAFTAIDDPKLLDLMRARSYAKVTAADYEEIRTRGTGLGLVEVG
ncbi:phosphate/phosphite/phosphonate ABC transporter substrate-binding protein [Actinophytocola sp.]|uniref:phosphate/phosphite/phosphonate ABC transporter substrate-binding protein n=1 Tax=Actinophytocola sp. TaxID=1872138 RepID=UPI003D6C1877